MALTKNNNYKNTILISMIALTLLTSAIAVGGIQNAYAGEGEFCENAPVPKPSIDPSEIRETLNPGEQFDITKSIIPNDNACFNFFQIDSVDFNCSAEFLENLGVVIDFEFPGEPTRVDETVFVFSDAEPGEYHCDVIFDLEYVEDFNSFAGILIDVTQSIWITVPEQNPFETEKFYTETDKDIEKGFFGTVLPFKNGIVDTGNPTQVVKAVVDRNGNIKSYNPGQYYAVTKVTALQNLDEVWIFEKDQECTEVTGISQWNPAKIPGGAYVAMMCDEVTVDLTSELAKSGALFRNEFTGMIDAHVDNVPEGCMVFLGVKYSPGLKGENVQSIDQPWCENWEIVNAVTESGDVFTDSAHMVLEVILPEPEPPG